jgi:alpha-1,2-mannosyltransferase
MSNSQLIGVFSIGFHAKTPAEFAEAFKRVLSLSEEEELQMRRRARQRAVQRFSEDEFEKAWDSCRWDRYLP